MSNPNPPDTTDRNPFSLIAYLLFHTRHALEDLDQPPRPPRWVRIVRGAPYKATPVGTVVSEAVDILAETLSTMVDLTLQLEVLLLQIDAAKAIAETSLKLIEASTDPNFQNGIKTLVGVSELGKLGEIMTAVNTEAQKLGLALDTIPEPEDLERLGEELYRLLCITQRRFPRDPNNNTIDETNPSLRGEEHLHFAHTGKARLCAWAYSHDVKTHGIGTAPDVKPLAQFGMRRLFKTNDNAGLPPVASLTWSWNNITVKAFEYHFSGANEAVDLAELVDLLQKHGYDNPPMGTPTDTANHVLNDKIRSNLIKFQAINDLPMTCELDNETINRLMHLDFGRKNLRRAKPYDATFAFPTSCPVNNPYAGSLWLVNPGADEFLDEGLALVPMTPHPYYVVPTKPKGATVADVNNWPLKQGWLSEVAGDTTQGFVALHSRARNTVPPGDFVGGIWSEGEAALGEYFFAARHVEPWIDGRSGVPTAPIFTDTLKPGVSTTRMFQWVPMPVWLDPTNVGNTPDGGSNWTLCLVASVLQRSLFTDRGGNGYPDRGRIRLEVYDSDGFTSTISPRQPILARASVATDLFPDLAGTTAALTLPQVDSKRLWTLRVTAPLEVPFDVAKKITGICVVAEGIHQSAYDIDAYFDDFRLSYFWKKTL